MRGELETDVQSEPVQSVAEVEAGERLDLAQPVVKAAAMQVQPGRGLLNTAGEVEERLRGVEKVGAVLLEQRPDAGVDGLHPGIAGVKFNERAEGTEVSPPDLVAERGNGGDDAAGEARLPVGGRRVDESGLHVAEYRDHSGVPGGQDAQRCGAGCAESAQGWGVVVRRRERRTRSTRGCLVSGPGHEWRGPEVRFR